MSWGPGQATKGELISKAAATTKPLANSNNRKQPNSKMGEGVE